MPQTPYFEQRNSNQMQPRLSYFNNNNNNNNNYNIHYLMNGNAGNSYFEQRKSFPDRPYLGNQMLPQVYLQASSKLL